MKRLVETEGEGMESLLNEKVTIFGMIYIYTGKLTGVNDSCIEIADGKIVYETGELDSGDWKDAQPLPSPWYIKNSAIESWGPAKC